MADQPQQEGAAPPPPRGAQAIAGHLLQHKVNAAMWFTRIITIFYGLQFFFPILNPASVSYSKLLLSNAATSALRLNQRLTSITFSRAFVMQVMSEDSFHYLLYSLTFLPCDTITLVTAPVMLFAVLHFASFTLTLCDVSGGRNSALAPRFLISLVEYHQRNILRIAALVEVILLPITVLNLFMGRVSLVTPFMVYQFVSLRYASRRNPYTRTMCHEMRVAAESAAARPQVPQAVRNAVHWMVARISSMAPPVAQ